MYISLLTYQQGSLIYRVVTNDHTFNTSYHANKLNSILFLGEKKLKA